MKGAEIPFMGFGLGVVNRYSRSLPLWLKRRYHQIGTSVKHGKLTRSLYADWHAKQIISNAWDTGFRLFDAGRIYGECEKYLGLVLPQKGDREAYTLTTKITSLDFKKKGAPQTVLGNLDVSLRYLKTDYVDIYFLHHPYENWLDMYHQMEDAFQTGKIRHLGVSNFTMEDFAQLEAVARIKPEFCQSECQPFFKNAEVRQYCKKNGIQFMAHTPTARNNERVRTSSVLQQIAAAHKKNIPQVILRWHLQNSVIPIVGSIQTAHMQENLNIMDFALTQEEMRMIDALPEEPCLLDCANGADDPLYRYNL